jgi:hypothetical protein
VRYHTVLGLLRRSDRDADDRRGERPKEAVREPCGLRLPLVRLGHLRPVGLRLGEGVHQAVGVGGAQRQGQHDVRAALEGEQRLRHLVLGRHLLPFENLDLHG